MNWRLICIRCKEDLGDEIKSVGIIEHPDLNCACCRASIRDSFRDRRAHGQYWFPITEAQLTRLKEMA